MRATRKCIGSRRSASTKVARVLPLRRRADERGSRNGARHAVARRYSDQQGCAAQVSADVIVRTTAAFRRSSS